MVANELRAQSCWKSSSCEPSQSCCEPSPVVSRVGSRRVASPVVLEVVVMEAFKHMHYWYAFSFTKPRRVEKIVMSPACNDAEKIEGFAFSRVFDGARYCTYVCEYTKPTPASQAIVTCKVAEVSTLNDLNPGFSSMGVNLFSAVDFDCVTDGKLVPLAFVTSVIDDETIERRSMKEMMIGHAISVEREDGRNDIMEKLLEQKLGSDFVVSRRAMTKRKGKDYNPFSKSRQDLCIQFKDTAFRNSTILTGVVTTSSTVVDATVADDGEILTGVVEFKRNKFEDDQTLAEMLCCMTDCSVEQLKGGKQITRAIAYGMSVNYMSKTAETFKITLDFVNNLSNIAKLHEDVPMYEAFNFVIASLKGA